jgi:nicotinamide mononucleotide (NMN) deamidase PncC
VGTVWIAVASKNGAVVAEKFTFGKIRERNVQRSVDCFGDALEPVEK